MILDGSSQPARELHGCAGLVGNAFQAGADQLANDHVQ